jgi:hypothetical protein
MSMEQRIKELIKLLVRATCDKSLYWHTTADENTFRLVSPTGNIRLTRSEGFDQEMQPYVSRSLSILNDKGRVIEEYFPSGAADCGDFDELFKLARRSAYRTDEVLERIMDEIQSQVQE